MEKHYRVYESSFKWISSCNRKRNDNKIVQAFWMLKEPIMAITWDDHVLKSTDKWSNEPEKILSIAEEHFKILLKILENFGISPPNNLENAFFEFLMIRFKPDKAWKVIALIDKNGN